jgi:malonate-semialdehyde dehydrogenase (acetylating)/methylmalonate-semialdehyde dehydrogenase
LSTTQQTETLELRNFVGGEWRSAQGRTLLDVINPATQKVIARVPTSTANDVDEAVRAAAEAFPKWRATPPEDRIQYLFKLKELLEKDLDEMGRIISAENGKTLTEAKAELRRAIENVEVACGIPTLMQGYNLEDVARGIDEIMIRQPLGVVAAITPFNFPGMIPFWFLPYAIACGNTFILKPSEKVPLTAIRAFELLHETGLPAGVANLVLGAKDSVDALLDHPEVRAISFVGSTPVARYIYARGAASGKRVQCQGGAKNHVVVLPDADMDNSAQVVAESAFGCAGQRCLAVSVAVTVGDAQKKFRDAVTDRASSLKVGYGLESGVEMGPVITRDSRSRIESLIGEAVSDGARPLIDGRSTKVAGYEDGNFVRPTVIDGLPADSKVAQTEIFGPVLSMIHASTIDEALSFLSRTKYGNAASIFTTSGASARQFRYEAPAGNIGVNIGVAAPMAYFPFSGWGESFFGIVHAQGRDAIEFYTDKKVVIERWASTLSRRF